MLANRVREFTITTGTGDITLGGALAGNVRFSDAFEVGDSILYVIEDGDNYEIGTGMLGSTDMFARTTVTETLVDGVHTSDGATAISLTGNARIYCTATAGFLLSPDKTADQLSEATEGAGVTIEDVLVRDGSVQAAGPVVVGAAPIRNWGETYDSLQVGATGSIMSYGAGGNTYITDNAYYDGVDWRYVETAGASSHRMDDGVHYFRVASAGQAETVVAWSDALTIDSSAIARFSGALLIPKGTASLPAIASQENPDTGIYWAGAGVRIAAGGMPVMETEGQDVSFTGAVKASAFSGSGFSRGQSDAELVVSAGSALGLGANIRGYGEAHSTKAGDMEFRADGSTWLSWQSSTSVASLFGSLGIGVTSPQNKLHLHEVGAEPVRLQLTNATTGGNGADGLAIMVQSSGEAVISQRETASLRIETGGQAALILGADQGAVFSGPVEATGATLHGNGNTPTLYLSGSSRDIAAPAGQLIQIGHWHEANQTWTEALAISETYIQASYALEVPDGNPSTPGIGFRNDAIGFYLRGSGQIGLAHAGADLLWVDGTGVKAVVPIRALAEATANRPNAATAGAGAQMFDTSLGKPIWSDGSIWVDATGASV